MEKWEYLQEIIGLEDMDSFNKYGSEGWELVWMRNHGWDPSKVICFFKRRIQ